MGHDAALSVSTVVLDGQVFARGLELLAQAGATLVEPAFIEGYMPFDETTFSERAGLALARTLRDAGLGVRAVSAHIDLGQPASAEKLRRRLHFAVAAGAGILITNATSTDGIDPFLATVAAIQPDLAALDMILALENPGHGHDALMPDGAQGAAFVAGLGDRRIRMNYDIGNAETYGARRVSATNDLAAALPVTAHLHLKDLKSVGGDWLFCPPGQGDIGYGTRLALNRLPPGLPIGIEYPIRLWRPGRGDPIRRATAPDEAEVIAAVRAALTFVQAALGSDEP